MVGAGVIGLVDPGSAMVLPLLATQILWLNLVTDSWPAMAMGLEPANSNVMAHDLYFTRESNFGSITKFRTP